MISFEELVTVVREFIYGFLTSVRINVVNFLARNSPICFSGGCEVCFSEVGTEF
jgi:hypothetical protein